MQKQIMQMPLLLEIFTEFWLKAHFEIFKVKLPEEPKIFLYDKVLIESVDYLTDFMKNKALDLSKRLCQSGC